MHEEEKLKKLTYDDINLLLDRLEKLSSFEISIMYDSRDVSLILSSRRNQPLQFKFFKIKSGLDSYREVRCYVQSCSGEFNQPLTTDQIWIKFPTNEYWKKIITNCLESYDISKSLSETCMAQHGIFYSKKENTIDAQTLQLLKDKNCPENVVSYEISKYLT